MMRPVAPGTVRSVALTGGTGFIGTCVLRVLSAAGWRVRALYRPRHARRLPDLPGVAWVAGNLADPDALRNLVTGTDAVVHLAGTVRGARRADFDRTNVEGTRRITAAAAGTPGCRRFLLLSSLAARVPELSDYAASKRRGEQAMAAAAGALEWTALRPPAVFGPGDTEMRPLFLAMARGVAILPGAARGRFSLLYVADLAAAIMSWLAADVAPGQCFELDDGTPGGYDWDTVIGLAAQVLRPARRVRRVPIPLPLLNAAAWMNLAAARVLGYAPMLTPGKVRELSHLDWVCNSGPFVRSTGWQPAFGLARGLAATFAKPVDLAPGVS